MNNDYIMACIEFADDERLACAEDAKEEYATLRQRLAAAEAAQQQTRIDAFQELLDEIDESVYVECWGYIEQKRNEAAAALAARATEDVASVPECNHSWVHNTKMGWKMCNKCGERVTTAVAPATAETGEKPVGTCQECGKPWSEHRNFIGCPICPTATQPT